MEKIKSKGRPRILSDDIKRLVARYHNKYPHWSARKILDTIYRQVFNTYKDKYPDWLDERIKASIKLPGLNSIQRYIRIELKANQAKYEKCTLGNTWHLGLMKQYAIPPEAIPHIMKVQDWIEKKGRLNQVTVRQAIWISRLYAAVKIKDAGELWKVSWIYSLYEIECDLSGTDPDTTALDKALRKISAWKGDRDFVQESMGIVKGDFNVFFQAYTQLEDLGLNLKEDGEL